MNKKDIEDLVGESMEDMGLVEYFCEFCGKAIENPEKSTLCISCQVKYFD